MPRSLPLYEGRELLAVEATDKLARDVGCSRCALHAGPVRNRCLPGDGKPGGLLFVGENPGRQEDASGRPFVGVTGDYVRRFLAAHWQGPVVLDNAIRCYPNEEKVTPKHVDACRGYLANVVASGNFTRIIAAGGVAARSILGRSCPPTTSRRAYAYTSQGVPVFVVFHPTAGLRNRFVRQAFEADMLWALSALPPGAPLKARAHLVETAEQSARAVALLRGASARGELLTIDIESEGQMYTDSYRVLCVGVSYGELEVAFVWTTETLEDPQGRAPLLALLADEHAQKGGTNVKFDMQGIAAAWGLMPRGVGVDVRLQRKLLEPGSDGALDAMAELVGMGGHKAEMAAAIEVAAAPVKARLAFEAREYKRIAAGKPPPKTRKPPPPTLAEQGFSPSMERVVRTLETGAWVYGRVPRTLLYRYNGRDVVSTGRVAALMRDGLAKEPELTYVWNTLVAPAHEAIAQVERWGIAVSKERVLLLGQRLAREQADMDAKLARLAPDVLWTSPQQVGKFFYEDLGLPVKRRTATGAPSTDAEALEAIADKHPAAKLLVRKRKFDMLQNTFCEPLMHHCRADGRVHPSILLDGAESGRASCQDPNLQNIPSEKKGDDENQELGKLCRDLFVAEPGNVLVSADYSQLELRIAAALSGDPEMLAIFKSGDDYHKRTAMLIAPIMWGITPEQVGKEHRRAAKTVNFGLVYGMGDEALAEDLGCTVEQAAKLRAAILGKFKVFSRWTERCVDYARKHGEVWTQWGGKRARRRRLWDIADQDGKRASRAKNGSFNTPVQGSASDYLLASLARSVQWILGDAVPAKLILPIHDQLLFEVRRDAVPEVVHGVRHIMTDHDSRGVPLVVDIEVGESWGSLVPYTA